MYIKDNTIEIPEDVVFKLKEDLKTHKGKFTKGTLITMHKAYDHEEKSYYVVDSADESDTMELRRDKITDFIKDVLEVDLSRTELFRSNSEEKTSGVSHVILIPSIIFLVVFLSVMWLIGLRDGNSTLPMIYKTLFAILFVDILCWVAFSIERHILYKINKKRRSNKVWFND